MRSTTSDEDNTALVNALRDALGDSMPRRLIVLGQPAAPERDVAGVALRTCQVGAVDEPSPDAAFVISQVSSDDPLPPLLELLAGLRNRLVPRILFRPAAAVADDEAHALRALGFVARGRSDAPLFDYDLDTTNAARDWNTPESWAHPGEFNKRRW